MGEAASEDLNLCVLSAQWLIHFENLRSFLMNVQRESPVPLR